MYQMHMGIIGNKEPKCKWSGCIHQIHMGKMVSCQSLTICIMNLCAYGELGFLSPYAKFCIWGSVAANFETRAASKLAARKWPETGCFRNYICSFEIRRLLLPRKSNLACRPCWPLDSILGDLADALVSKLRPRISNLAKFRVVQLDIRGRFEFVISKI